MVRAMRDDSQSIFSGRSDSGDTVLSDNWRPSWTGFVPKNSGMTDETVGALLLLVLSGADEHQRAAAASERIVNLLSEMEAHPPGTPTDNAVRARLVKRLSAALSGLREELG